MQPCLAGAVIATSVDRFVQNISEVASETDDFLFEPKTNLVRQIIVVAIPQLVTAIKRILDTATYGLDCMNTHWSCIERRKVPMPVNNFLTSGFGAFHGIAALLERFTCDA